MRPQEALPQAPGIRGRASRKAFPGGTWEREQVEPGNENRWNLGTRTGGTWERETWERETWERENEKTRNKEN
ncbi:hypothetical protein [Microseira sp. BLCC-F43]|jgi:hypothetical protein|uniref:hypothetical protein n=1 Tax=Microseira sp. BLCC-F43 TaxID=3153602 RepID=UPI0035BB025D